MSNKKGVKKPQRADMKPADCRALRLALGMTQVTFAEKLGVTEVTVIRWETGKIPISRGRAMSIRGLTVGLPKRPSKEAVPA